MGLCHGLCVCRCIYSGSWDYSVRVWHRSSLELAGVVPCDDWVFSLASRGDHLLAGAASRLLVSDLTTLKPLKQIQHQVKPGFKRRLIGYWSSHVQHFFIFFFASRSAQPELSSNIILFYHFGFGCTSSTLGLGPIHTLRSSYSASTAAPCMSAPQLLSLSDLHWTPVASQAVFVNR